MRSEKGQAGLGVSMGAQQGNGVVWEGTRALWGIFWGKWAFWGKMGMVRAETWGFRAKLVVLRHNVAIWSKKYPF